jgi:hypothetical protein
VAVSRPPASRIYWQAWRPCWRPDVPVPWQAPSDDVSQTMLCPLPPRPRSSHRLSPLLRSRPLALLVRITSSANLHSEVRVPGPLVCSRSVLWGQGCTLGPGRLWPAPWHMPRSSSSSRHPVPGTQTEAIGMATPGRNSRSGRGEMVGDRPDAERFMATWGSDVIWALPVPIRCCLERDSMTPKCVAPYVPPHTARSL